IVDIAGAIGDIGKIGAPCFAAGTPLLTPAGHKSIEEFSPGDLILAAPEEDGLAHPEARAVEEVFHNYARLLNLHVGGRVIWVPSEHPFDVWGRGWRSTGELQVGDLLCSHDGRRLPVQAVTDSGEQAVVYNLRIAEYHTYFVGAKDWGFS